MQPSAAWLLENRGFMGRGMEFGGGEGDEVMVETSRAKHEYNFGGVV